MKLLAQICGIIVLSSVSLTSTENLFAEEPKLQSLIDDIFNKIIIDLIASLPEPITIDQLPISLNKAGIITGDVSISDLSLSGLKELKVEKIKTSILHLTLDATIVVPQIIFSTKYGASISVLEKIPIFGNGTIDVNIENISLNIGGKVNLTGGFSLSNVTVSFTLGNAEFLVVGLLNNKELSELLTESLNADLVPFLNDNEELISKLISPIAGELINRLLNGSKKESVELLLQELFTDADQLANIQKEK